MRDILKLPTENKLTLKEAAELPEFLHVKLFTPSKRRFGGRFGTTFKISELGRENAEKI